MSLSALQGAEWDSHVLLVYHDEPQRRASVASWMRRGLDRGEKVIYTHLEDDAAFLAGLDHGPVDVTAAHRRRQLELVPVEEFYSVPGQRPMVQQALQEGYPAVRLCAQAEAALAHLRPDDYLRYDLAWEELCRQLPVSVLCQYDVRWRGEPRLEVVLGTHPDAVNGGQLRLQRRGDELAVLGEADLRQVATLRESLRVACSRAEPGSRVVVDASLLEFLDVAGCRALVTGTEEFRRTGGEVVISGVQPHVLKVMMLLRLDGLPGLRLEETSTRGA